MSDESDAARLIAGRVLDRPYGDPDDDLAILARQLLRTNERLAALKELMERQQNTLNEYPRLRQDAERYRHMRKSAAFQDRNGPGLYWYLPRWNRDLPLGERLDAAIDEDLHAPGSR